MVGEDASCEAPNLKVEIMSMKRHILQMCSRAKLADQDISPLTLSLRFVVLICRICCSVDIPSMPTCSRHLQMQLHYKEQFLFYD